MELLSKQQYLQVLAELVPGVDSLLQALQKIMFTWS